jgi:glycosyltransferase involved in cell wall biosynthesis
MTTERGPKKICILMPSHYSAKAGGAEIQVKLIMDALLARSSVDIHYVCRFIHPDFKDSRYNICTIGNEKGFGKYGFIFDVKDIYRALREVSPDVIYQRVGCAYTGIAAFYVRKRRCKLIWHISSNNEIEPFPEESLKRRLRYSLDRRFLIYGIKNADIVIGQTAFQNNLLKKHFNRACDFIIPNGHPVPKEIYHKPEGIRILWVGSLKPLKQPHIFVSLARKFRHYKNLSFIMIGRAVDKKILAQIQRDIENVPNLQYVGEISNDEVNQYFNEGNILVNTSKFEGFSNTFIQAWMRNVPIVSLNADPDGILSKEHIGFKSGSSDKLCEDIKRLIENKSFSQEMGRLARQLAIERFSIDITVDRLLDVFQTM